MEPEPHFSATSQRMFISLWGREERATHGCVPESRQITLQHPDRSALRDLLFFADLMVLARSVTGSAWQRNRSACTTYVMEGRCLITTSRACIASNGMFRERPSRASSSAYKLICATHFIATLNTRSLPSPGSVTSSSTCNKKCEEQLNTKSFQFLFMVKSFVPFQHPIISASCFFFQTKNIHTKMQQFWLSFCTVVYNWRIFSLCNSLWRAITAAQLWWCA